MKRIIIQTSLLLSLVFGASACDHAPTPDVRVYSGGQEHHNPIENVTLCPDEGATISVIDADFSLYGGAQTLEWGIWSGDPGLVADGGTATVEMEDLGYASIWVRRNSDLGVSDRRIVWFGNSPEECDDHCFDVSQCSIDGDCCEGQTCDLLSGQCVVKTQ